MPESHNYQCYLKRFEAAFGDKPVGAFVKHENHMVQRLNEADFAKRLDNYFKWHEEASTMVVKGRTISDGLLLEFAEASSWLILKSPSMMDIFDGLLPDAYEVVQKVP